MNHIPNSNILLLNPFHQGSHKQWAKSLVKHSKHNIDLWELPGRHWKWRMHGAAVHFAQMIQNNNINPDIILSTDMLDMSTLRGLMGHALPGTRYYTYFHENQISYPWSPTDRDVELKRDFHYAFINYTTALASDKLFFNSNYHLSSFLAGLKDLLNRLPDNVDLSTIDAIESKSKVLYLGLDLVEIEVNTRQEYKTNDKTPVLLWNHRWEYDKNPELFFNTLFHLSDEGADFKLIVTGQSYRNYPPIFDEAKIRLADHLIHFGYTSSREEYLDLLRKSDILPVTNIQDFFGGSIIEAIHAGALPLLPDRLAYPEHIPKHLQSEFIYDADKGIQAPLVKLISELSFHKNHLRDIQKHISQYDWNTMIQLYDQAFAL